MKQIQNLNFYQKDHKHILINKKIYDSTMHGKKLW